MKKLLFIVAMAVAFMACENKAEMPKQEQKAMKAATVEVVDMIGTAKPADVQKTLLDAGFTKVEAQLAMPAKCAAQAKANMKKAIKAEGTEEIYVYGLPDNFFSMSEDEQAAYMKKQLESGDGFIQVTVTYQSDVLYASATVLMTGLREKINVTYANESDALYAALPKPIVPSAMEWQGVTYGPDDDEGTEYTDHAKFVAAVAAAKGIHAEETGYSLTAVSATASAGKAYMAMWMNPGDDAEAQQDMVEEMGAACAYGYFVVADVNYMAQ
ncbi:MAG: hypothetical protein II144_05070 [Paludibacteraceae bacterium]|nr:hypothetical protein [Paludibacteraceae bacterium]